MINNLINLILPSLYNANIQILSYFLNDPLSRFPQRGKALFGAPSPLGEGWEGGMSCN